MTIQEVFRIRFNGAAGVSLFVISALVMSALATAFVPLVDDPSSKPSNPAPDAGVDATFDIPVHLGWNFISIPLVQWNTSVLEVLDDHGGDTTWDRVMWYDPLDAINHNKQYYTVWNATFNDLTDINHTMGFQMNVTDVGSDGALQVNGTLPGATDVLLYEGWNMIGYPTVDDASFTVGNLKASTNVTQVENITDFVNATGDTLPDTYVLKRGEGYWMISSANCTWAIANALAGSPPNITLVSPANNTVFQPGTTIGFEVNGSASMDASLNGGAWTTFNSPFEIDTDSWTDGAKVLDVRAANANGTTTASFDFIVDSVEPDIDLLAPVEGSDVKVGDTLHFNITEDNLASANCTAGEFVVNMTGSFDVDTTGWADGLTAVRVTATDLAGNSESEDFSFVFDGTAPSIESVSPANASTAVSAGASLVIHFSEGMDRNATESAVSIAPSVEFAGFAWNADSNQLTVDIEGNLSQNTRYRVSVNTLARDAVGNPMNATFRWEFTTWLDIDGDGLTSNQDLDDDGDGYMDGMDAFPEDPDEWVDTDGDGIGDNADLDDDDDGVADQADAYPLDQYESLDSDGDGVGDNMDEFPNDPTETVDSDGDGLGDNEDFLPYFNNSVFYSIVIMAPCITVVLVALIISRSRARRVRAESRRDAKKSKEEGDSSAAKPEGEAPTTDDGGETEELEPAKEAPKRREPQDPMAPPPDD